MSSWDPQISSSGGVVLNIGTELLPDSKGNLYPAVVLSSGTSAVDLTSYLPPNVCDLGNVAASNLDPGQLFLFPGVASVSSGSNITFGVTRSGWYNVFTPLINTLSLIPIGDLSANSFEIQQVVKDQYNVVGASTTAIVANPNFAGSANTLMYLSSINSPTNNVYTTYINLYQNNIADPLGGLRVYVSDTYIAPLQFGSVNALGSSSWVVSGS